MPQFIPEKIVIEERVKDSKTARRVLAAFPNIPVAIEKCRTKATAEASGYAVPRSLRIAAARGRLVKKCPATPRYVCCGLNIINTVVNCPISCTYCILQSYLNSQELTFVAETDKIIAAVEKKIKTQPQKILRFTSGELGDSLIIDSITGISEELVNLFAGFPRASLELKTKTTEIDNLLNLEHRGRVIVSWSVNPERIVRAEELNAAPLAKRLKAARRAQEAGYKLAFHFDPIFDYPGGEKDYLAVAGQILDSVPPRKIAWVSLGCFRFLPPLKAHIKVRYPESRHIYGEFFPARDGKMRYLMRRRIEIYGKLYQALKKRAPDLCVYLCMEAPEVWRAAFNMPGMTGAKLARMLDERVTL